MEIALDDASPISRRRLRRLAKRAFRTRRLGEQAFRELSTSTGVSLQRLRLLADAWAQGGREAVDALGGAKGNLPDDVVAELDAALESWRRQHYPLETLQWEIWRNRVTVWQLVPGRDRLGPAGRTAVLQLRHADMPGWFLYRLTRGGDWWPVVISGSCEPVDLDRCLDTVRLDIARQFWSPPTTSPALPRRRS